MVLQWTSMLDPTSKSIGPSNTDVDVVTSPCATWLSNTCANQAMPMTTIVFVMEQPPPQFQTPQQDQLPKMALETICMECTSPTNTTKHARTVTVTRDCSLPTVVTKVDSERTVVPQSTPVKTTTETVTVTNVPKNVTTTHTGHHPHGTILQSSPKTPTGAISTNPNPKTSKTVGIAKKRKPTTQTTNRTTPSLLVTSTKLNVPPETANGFHGHPGTKTNQNVQSLHSLVTTILEMD